MKYLIGIFLIVLVACDTDPTPTRREVDALAGQQNLVATREAVTLQAPTRTAEVLGTTQAQAILSLTHEVITATALPPNVTIVTPPPNPTVFVNDEDDILGNVVVSQNWQSYPFTSYDGSRYSAQTFAGSVLLIHLIDLECQPCQFQQQAVREVAQLFYEEARPYEVVFVTLNVDTRTTARALGNWAETYKLENSEELNWIVATASEELKTEIAATFGSESIDPQTITMIVVDQAGLGHISRLGTIDANQVRDILIFYADPAIATEEPES